jgi:general secretion pathway protein A
MCRQLIRRFSQKEEIETHLILDPHVLNATEFLATVNERFTGDKPSVEHHEWQIKEQIKQYLFRKGVDENKTVVLIIDEGQKIPTFCLEILREFLNYETNEYKLLQIVIFAQKEFEGTIRKYPNFADRINLYHLLRPLNFRDTRLMIKFRLEKSCSSNKQLRLFTFPALWMIYRISGGYPRKIINLCHQSILVMIIQNRSKCSYRLVSTCAHRIFPEESNRRPLVWAAATTAVAVFIALFIFLPSNKIQWLQKQSTEGLKTVFNGEDTRHAGPSKSEKPPQTFRAQIAAPEIDNRTLILNKPDGSPKSAAALAPPASFNEPGLQPEKASPKETVAQSREKPNPDKSLNSPPPTPQAIPDTTVEATVEHRSEDISPAANSAPRYASILGQITLKRHETLSRIIMSVYGDFNSKYFKSFIIANPDIEDPDRVNVGQVISLPAIPVSITPAKKPVWWVRVDDRDSLESAFEVLRGIPDNSPAMRMIPYWIPSAGFRFAVVLDELFKDELGARRRLQRLPGELADKSTILTRWDQRTVYFANPYFN